MPSAFHYMTNSTNSPVDCPACCAGFDEQTFYNAKYETIPDDEPVYSSYGGKFHLSLNRYFREQMDV